MIYKQWLFINWIRKKCVFSSNHLYFIVVFKIKSSLIFIVLFITDQCLLIHIFHEELFFWNMLNTRLFFFKYIFAFNLSCVFPWSGNRITFYMQTLSRPHVFIPGYKMLCPLELCSLCRDWHFLCNFWKVDPYLAKACICSWIFQ